MARECEAERTVTPLTEDQNREIVDLETALGWWPHRPLLTFADAEGRQIFVIPQVMGTRCDPQNEACALFVLQLNGQREDEEGMWGLVDTGASFLGVYYGNAPRYAGTRLAHKPVEVRGRPSRLAEFYRDRTEEQYRTPWIGAGGSDKRYVEWSEPTTGDGVLTFSYVENPRLRTEAETMAAINRLATTN